MPLGQHKKGLFSNYCGLGGQGIPQHTIDRLCKRHDEQYQEIMNEGHNPYFSWNYADEQFLKQIEKVSPSSKREKIVQMVAQSFFRFKHYMTSQSNLPDPEQAAIKKLRTNDSMSVVANNRQSGAGQKRKIEEEHGMEPEGHGNTPATGTEQAHFIKKYVPVNFMDKFTVKLRYTNTYKMRSVATAGTQAVPAYVIWRTNSVFQPEFSNSINTFVANAHQPNQRDNWAAQFGYYRVESFDYKIHVINILADTVVQTQNPPGTFVGASQISDAIVTLLKTQTSTDITNTQQNALWEQKQAHNVVVPARSAGHIKSYHIFENTVDPEDFDIDPLTTAQDETWTAIGANPATTRLMGISVCPWDQTTTAAQLPEIGISLFVEFIYTVQFAGYTPGLRQTIS